jgi:hypothetical protein
VLIDEGSQVTVANSSLALHYLNTYGRLIIAGDHKQVCSNGYYPFVIIVAFVWYYYLVWITQQSQLPPIIKGRYPQGELKHYGSILECLLRDAAVVQEVRPFDTHVVVSDGVNEDQVLCSKLRENNRMNLSLAGFVQFTHGADYQSQNPNQRLKITTNQIGAVVLQGSPQQELVLRNAISMDASMCIINIRVDMRAAMTREDMAQTEALMVELWTGMEMPVSDSMHSAQCRFRIIRHYPAS